MNVFGTVKTAAGASARSCGRRVCDPGPSRLTLHAGLAGPSWQAFYAAGRAVGPRRSFYSSTVADFTPTAAIRLPRWVNARLNPSRDQKSDDAESQTDVSQSDARLDSPEDGQSAPPASAPPSAPPSSSSSGSSGDGSDGSDKSDPPTPPPPADTPPQPQTSISKQSVPEVYPQVLALPIARRPLFPGFYKAVVIRNPAVVSAIKEMMRRGQPYLGAFLLKDENADSDIITDINSVHPVGVFAQITSVFTAQGNKDDDKEEGLTAVLYPHRRIKITELVKDGSVASVEEVQSEESMALAADSDGQQLPTPPPERDGLPMTMQTSFLEKYAVSVVNVDNLATQPYNKDDQYIRAFMSEIVSVFKDIAQLNPLFRDQIANFSINQVASNVFDEPDKLADFAAAVSTGEPNELQDVLESLIVDDRLRKALLVLKKELINAQLQSKLARDVDSKIAKRQREYYLMEQLKGIKKELGMESDGKDKLIEKFKERAATLKMPEGVRKVFDEDLNKLMHLEPAASEANVTRNYLEWLTQVCSLVHLRADCLSDAVLCRFRGACTRARTTPLPTRTLSSTKTITASRTLKTVSWSSSLSASSVGLWRARSFA